MRTVVFFDLPTETIEDKRNYRKFRKSLIKNGFYMLQESVYTRMVITPSAERTAINKIKTSKPPNGIVQILTVTEKQFSNMECITGTFHTDVIDNDKRLIIL